MKQILFSIVLVLSAFYNVGCETAGKDTAFGAGVGAAAGAVVGALVSKDKKKGALIGAALGGTIGGVAGNRLDKQKKELEKIAETRRTDNGLVTKLKSDILFDTGKSDLKPAANKNISQIAGIMKKYPEDILTIKGFTDSTGSVTVNKELSEKRAGAVKSQLVANGFPESAITVLGMGPDEPVAPNTTADGRSKNRRVEIEVTVDESKIPKK